MAYETNIVLERRFSTVLKAILGNYFICQDPVLDKQEATDFATFTVSPFKVGVRLRRYQYYCRYRDEFTVRCKLPSGVPTELDKLLAGLVDYILYGFVDQQERSIIQYFIGDLGVFRDANPRPHYVGINNPPDSTFAAYRLRDMPLGFVVKLWPSTSLA